MRTPYTDDAIRQLIAQFEDHTLPAEAWTHEAHLVTALWYLLHDDYAAVLPHYRTCIRSFNEAKGGVNDDANGYHETITRVYLKAIDGFLQTTERDRPFADLAADLLASPIAGRRLPLRHYSRARLFSVEARHGWVEPDRKPLG